MPLSPAKIRQYGDLRAKQATNALTITEAKKLEDLVVELNKPKAKAKKRATKTSTLALAKAGDKKPAATKAKASPKK